MRIITVVGARPNFVKIASFMSELEQKPGVQSLLVHTGQHYDPSLSDLFFTQLGIRKPDVNLGVGSGSHAEQTARLMTGFENVLKQHPAACVVVVGDVNSTMACAITAKKALVSVAHIEAGLRSGDRTMPEEINRLVTDSIADFLFTTTSQASENLRREGVPESRIFLVGNIMIDSLVRNRERAASLTAYKPFGLEPKEYILLTLHRPANVDEPEVLRRLTAKLSEVHARCPILFLAHPRTQAKLVEAKLVEQPGDGHAAVKTRFCWLANPVGYLEMINLEMNAKFVITDSGGVQEETTILGIPCLTFRENTERPETVTVGTNLVVGTQPENLVVECEKILSGQSKKGGIPDLWDGQTGKRIVERLLQNLR